MTVEESIKIYRFDNGKIDYPGNTQEKKKKKTQEKQSSTNINARGK